MNYAHIWSSYPVALLCVGLMVGAQIGCVDDYEPEPQTKVVRALWDPAAAILPTPTDLVKNRQTGRLDIANHPDDSDAQREFNAYLNSLDGYPLATTLTVPMSDEVHATGLGEAFFVMNAADGARVDLAVALEESGRQIKATPIGGDGKEFSPGEHYIFGLRGYDGGLQGAFGEPVIADAGFYLVRSQSPLEEHPDLIPGESEAERLENTAKLSAIQTAYASLITQATNIRGFKREQLAVIAEFSTTDEPAVWFDPNLARIPMPNQLLIDPQTGLVNLPIDPDDQGEVLQVKQTLSKYDGFSISGAIVLKSTHPLDPQSALDPASVRLFERRPDTTFREVTDLERGILSDGKTMRLRPKLTLEPGRDYIYISTKSLVDSRQKPLRAQPVGAMLRGAHPLLENDTPQVSVLDLQNAQLLEPVRKKSAPLINSLREELIISQDIGAAVPFHTMSSAQKLLDARAELYRQDVRTDLINVQVKSPLARGLWVAMPQVKTVVSGQLFIQDHLDPRTRQNFSDGHAEETPVSFVLTIPGGAKAGEPIPVVLFGHGLMTSRELTYLIADKLAGAGYAVFSLDLPYHGKRSVCVEDVQCVGNATCDEVGACVLPDGTPGEIASIRVPFMDFEYPSATGFSFVDVENLIGTRDHFAQALLDLMQGVRVIQQADWARHAEGYVLDGSDIMYLGMSLGGILGASLSALEPEIQDFVLNVPGADFLALVENSDAFTSIFNDALAQRGAPKGSDAYFDFANIIRWLLDPVDPLNIAHHTLLDPLEYSDPLTDQVLQMPPKRVLIQMAKNDAVVPNIATKQLSKRMQVPISEYQPTVSNHAFLFDPTSLSGIAARREMIEFFDARH